MTALTRPERRGERIGRLPRQTRPFEARVLVAADGRNSTIARLCNLLPRSAKERIALQTHLPLPHDFGNRVVLQFRPEGYSGQAPVGDGELNLCLVSVPRKMPTLRSWAETRFGISPEHSWRTITPLTRAPISAAHPSLFSDRRRGAGGRAIYGRRHLLRAGFRRTCCRRDYFAAQWTG